MQSENDQYIEKLYRQYFRQVQLYAVTIVHNNECAEEIAQDVFHLAFCKIEEIRDCDKPIKWLCKVAANISRNYLRRQERYRKRIIAMENAALAEIPEPGETLEDSVIERIEGDDTDAIQIRNFEKRLRKILTEDEFTLYCHLILKNEPHIVVAKSLGISVWACQKRWQRARKKIHKEFYEKEK